MLGCIHKEEITPWEGAILTSVVSEYENLDQRGHGAKLEATNMIPSSWLIWLDCLGFHILRQVFVSVLRSF